MRSSIRSRRQRAAAATVRHLGASRAEALLLERLAQRFADASRQAGESLLCGPGCHECCSGPFPITSLDAARLERGLVALQRDQPVLARVVRQRAQAAREAMVHGFPGDPRTGKLDADEATLDRYFERHAGLACPALDPLSGRCDLYAWRPVACRTYGPPLRFAGENAPPCRLCFQGASPVEIDACRMEPDPEGLEQALLESHEGASGREWETVIAFVLARGTVTAGGGEPFGKDG